MQRLAEYLENARQFERLAADEENPAIKAQFEKQAAAYRKLAERRAEFLSRTQGQNFIKNPALVPISGTGRRV
jgi:hypothetical protein